jgi:hypothetical protein
MCPTDKIGVVDFPTFVYNQAPKNAVRTQEREHVDNSKFEIEIRNSKHYKEGLSGEKLPQVNVIGDFKERNSIASEFSYVYNQLDGEFDITLIQDGDIIKFIDGELPIKRGKIIADIHEAPHLLDQHKVYDAVKNNHIKFDKILTFDSELLKLPNSELIFIGDISNDFKQIIKKYLNIKNIKFIKKQNQERLKFFYNIADLFVLCSIEEGLAMVQAQAMACGLPVICTTNTGGSEVIDDGINGYVIPIRNINILMHKIKILYNDTDKLQEMSKNAYIKANSELSWKKYGDRMFDIYQKLLQDKLMISKKSH